MKTLRLLLLLLPLLLSTTFAFSSRILHDELGRDVAVPDNPHRLICLAPSITDTVFALGAGGRVVGITDYTKYPSEALSKPSVGGVINPSLEKVASLNPDLVLAIGDLNNSDLIRSIERLGFPLFVVQPHGVEGIYRSIQSIGQALNDAPGAASLVTKLRAREAAVRRSVSGKSVHSMVFLLWADPIITVGKGAFITELIEIAGGRSVTMDLPSEWPRVSMETLVLRQPEYVVLVRDSALDLGTLQKREGWRNLNAIRKERVLYVDDRIDFPSPLAFDALEDLARQLHP